MTRHGALAALLLAAAPAGLPLVFQQYQAFTSVEAATCKTLADKDSTLRTALVTMNVLPASTLDDLPLDQVFANVDANLPWVSQCMAAIDPMTVYTQVMSSTTFAGCLKAMNTTVLPSDEQMMTADVFKNTICPLYNDTIIPCVMDGIVDAAVRALATTSGCCDAFTAKINESFGADLRTMVDLLLQYVGNVVCAQKTVTATTSSTTTTATPQYCGLSLLSAFGSAQSDMMAMFNFGQIPNAQACDAMAGSSFLNTLGVKTTLPLASSADIGICFQPVDLLLQHVRDYPLMKSYAMVTGGADGTTSVPLSNLFAEGKCVQGDALIEWMTLASSPLLSYVGVYDAFMIAFMMPSSSSESSSYGGSSASGSYTSTNLTTILATSLDSLKSAAKAFCFHLPNNASCAYSGQKIVYPYSKAAATVDVSASTSTTSSSSSTRVALSSSLLITVLSFVVAMLLMQASS